MPKDIAFESDKRIFLNLRLSLWGPPGYCLSCDFSPKILCVKRPQLSETAKNRTKIPSSWPERNVSVISPTVSDQFHSVFNSIVAHKGLVVSKDILENNYNVYIKSSKITNNIISVQSWSRVNKWQIMSSIPDSNCPNVHGLGDGPWCPLWMF